MPIRKSLLEIVDCLREGVLITDTGGEGKGVSILYCNKAMEEITGYKKHEIIGKNPRMFQGEATDKEAVMRIRQALEAQQSVTEEIINYHKSGLPYWVEIRISPIFNDQGICEAFFAIELDVTQKKAREEALQNARLQAESANRTKSQFLANMSHELRTPVHNIQGFAELLLEKMDSIPVAKREHYVRSIEQSSGRLLVLLNDLLDVSRLEAGKMRYDMRHQAIYPIMSAAVKECERLAREKPIQIEMHESVEVLSASCDVGRILQVLINVLSNAIKFSPVQGVISVELRHHEPWVEIAITDQGIGIPEQEIGTIFDLFIQSSRTESKAGGTGLGLSICKAIMQDHGGDIVARNNPSGVGSCFTIRLPDASDRGER